MLARLGWAIYEAITAPVVAYLCSGDADIQAALALYAASYK